MNNWAKHGFEPVVLNAWWALDHPFGRRYLELVSALPSVNPAGYEVACYLRWLAVANAMKEGETAIMLDYDVFITGKGGIPKDLDLTTLCVLDESGVPGAVVGASIDFALQADRFAAYKPHADDLHGTTPHVSDMLILMRQLKEEPGLVQNYNVLRAYTDPGWEKAALVHFSNDKMNGKTPRWQHIPQLITV